LNKLRQSLPLNYFLLLQSYLRNRHFFHQNCLYAPHPVTNLRRHIPRQCPRAFTIPHVHCGPSNLPNNNHRHIYRRYNHLSHGQ
jgi:hypothetical protein